MSNFHLLDLLHFSKFSDPNLFTETLKQLHLTEVIQRKRINQILSTNKNNSMVFPINHWNGEQAEKSAGQKFKSEEESGMCLFAKFTQSLCALLNVVSAPLVPTVRAQPYLNSSVPDAPKGRISLFEKILCVTERS